MRPETENFDLDISISDARVSTKTEQSKPEEQEPSLKSGGAAVAAWMLRNVYLNMEDESRLSTQPGSVDEKR